MLATAAAAAAVCWLWRASSGDSVRNVPSAYPKAFRGALVGRRRGRRSSTG